MLPCAELTEWQAAAALDPWGEDKTEIQLARLCSLVANSAGITAAPAEFLVPPLPAAPVPASQSAAVFKGESLRRKHRG